MIFQSSLRKLNNLPLEQVGQTIVDTVGQVLKVDIAILCLDSSQEKYFVYQNLGLDENSQQVINWGMLKLTVNSTEDITIIEDHRQNCQENQSFDSATSLAYQQANIRSTLSVPLLCQHGHIELTKKNHQACSQDLVGILVLHYCKDVHIWESEEIRLAAMMATQAALAIAQVRAYEKLQAFAQRESMVNSLTAAIRSSLEPEVIFAAITKELGQALGVDGCTLSLWTKEDEFVQCVAFYNPYEQDNNVFSIQFQPKKTPNSSSVPISENPILQELLITKKPAVLEDLEEQKEMARQELSWHSKARALLIVPLIVDGEIIGSITLRQSQSSRCWNESEIELVEAVAAQAAIAVQQAKLYETTKQQATQLQEREQKVKQLNNYLTESVLKRFLPEAIVNQAAVGELVLDLSPEPNIVTILFADLVGFTSLSSYLEANSLARLLNEYLEAMAKAVFEQRGTVDKFIGDGIMALFGAPEDLPPQEQAQRAIASARSMQQYLQQLNQSWQAKGIFADNSPLKLRCGIHQGRAVVGMFGGKQRKDYTAIGKAVNIAARLEEAANPGSILISAAVAAWIEDQEIQQGRSLQLRGIKEELQVFSLKV